MNQNALLSRVLRGDDVASAPTSDKLSALLVALDEFGRDATKERVVAALLAAGAPPNAALHGVTVGFCFFLLFFCCALRFRAAHSRFVDSAD